jgi:hypothetical protein
MSRIVVTCGSQTAVVGFVHNITTNDELKHLLRLEFGLDDKDELSLCQTVRVNKIIVVVIFY